jgi:predicted ATPase/DNA-binding SARP family transcriptional activator
VINWKSIEHTKPGCYTLFGFGLPVDWDEEMLEVRLLGGFEVKHDNKIVTISSRPAQSLFAYLILNTGRSHRREKLAGLLWPDSTEENARNYLRNGLWKLRKAIEKESSKIFGDSYILADDISVSFNPEAPYTLDVATIEDIEAECASTDGLMDALSFYEGELLPGFYDEWIVLEREHIQAVFEQKIEWLLKYLQEKARWSDCLDWGERWISFGQKPEAAYRFLITAHAARGDMSKVVAIFERCTKSLDEIGVKPSEQTLTLFENLKSGKEKFEKEKSTIYPNKTKTTTSASRTNLPVPLTSFIGREKEIDEVLNLLGERRLLTLTGSGGVGKTRLAIEAANKVVSKYKDGVWWVDLVNLTDQSLVPQAVAKVLDVHEIPDQNLTQTLIEYFQTRQALIVLNNCEHLVSACAKLAGQLLSACAELKILTTGREALDILGETIWQVPSLTLPNTQNTQEFKTFNEFESVRLFVDRAQSVKPTFELTEQNGGSIAQICQRLSGMPLAIELAAARIKIMSTEEIALRLDDCFDLLTSGSRTALPHHQTLRATIDWSYDLLSKVEKTFICRLSVFVDGFTLDAAEAVAAGGDVAKRQVVDLLEQLVNKSLITVAASSEEGEDRTRFGMLETIREYLYEKLEISGEIQKVQEQRLIYFIAYTEEAERYTHSDNSVLWLRKLGKDIDNIRAALDWCIESGKAIEAFRLIGALISSLFQFDSPSEWQKRLDTVLALSSGQEKSPERAKALCGIGELYWSNVNPVDKTPELQEALAIGRHLGDKLIIAKALSNLGLFASLQDNLVEARSYLEESFAIFNEVSSVNKRNSVETLTYLGEVAFNQGKHDEARTLYQECVYILEETGDKISLALVFRRLGQLALREDDHKTAITLCIKSLNMNREIEDQRGILASISAFAAIAQARGQGQAAAQLFGAVQAVLSAMNLRFLKMDRIEYERNLASLNALPDQASLEKARIKGSAMTTEQAVEFALKQVD